MSKTLVLGASINPHRYSNIAIHKLVEYGFETVALGLKPGIVAGVSIETGMAEFQGIHTITLYLNSKRQKDYYDYIMMLKPKRIIFNPGTANPEFTAILDQKKISWENACTLVLLSTNQYK